MTWNRLSVGNPRIVSNDVMEKKNSSFGKPSLSRSLTTSICELISLKKKISRFICFSKPFVVQYVNSTGKNNKIKKSVFFGVNKGREVFVGLGITFHRVNFFIINLQCSFFILYRYSLCVFTIKRHKFCHSIRFVLGLAWAVPKTIIQRTFSFNCWPLYRHKRYARTRPSTRCARRTKPLNTKVIWWNTKSSCLSPVE